MKKNNISLIIMCCIALAGCDSKPHLEEGLNNSQQINEDLKSDINAPAEYTYSEIKTVSETFWGKYLEEFNNLSDAEIYGLSDDEEKENESYFEVSEKCAKKADDELNIERGQKVIVTGYISGVREIPEETFFARKGCGVVGFYLKGKSSDDQLIGLSCKTNDKDFLNLQDNTPIKIEATFLKPGLSGDNADLYECKIIESGEPEIVEQEPAVTAAPKFD